MRVLDMRLTVLVTLILLGAAMPANCAEEPTASEHHLTAFPNPDSRIPKPEFQSRVSPILLLRSRQ